MNARHYLLSAFLPCLMLTACEPREVERRWSEEVAIEGVGTRVIDRSVVFVENNSWSGDAFGTIEKQSSLSLRDDLAHMTPWEAPLQPLVLYRDGVTNEWVVVANSSRCETWAARGKPLRPYWEFRFREGQWLEVPLSKSSLGRETNLFFFYEAGLPAKHIDLATKQALMGPGSAHPKYLSIESRIDRHYCR